jgi:hypothetical protein
VLPILDQARAPNTDDRRSGNAVSHGGVAVVGVWPSAEMRDMAVDRGPSSRGTLRGWVRRHLWLTGGVAALAIGGAVFVLVWFQPQALLFDTVVDDDFPAVEARDEAPSTADVEPAADDEGDDRGSDTDEPQPEGEASGPETQPAGPVAVAAGNFASRNRYTVTGTVTVYEIEDGSRTLRLEDFESTNGPDLYVYLTAADHADDDEELDRDVVDLGALRGNIGDQNYDIPDDVDLAHHDTVVIWCLRFTSSFGAADLTLG